MKGCILPFPKKGDLGIAKNYRGITLTSIAAKIYNALIRNRIEPKIDNILRKTQNGFRRNRSTTSQILTIRRILEGVRAKNLQAPLIFVDFTKAFDSLHKGKMEQILLAYGIPKETVAAITILYRNTKVKVRSPDGDTEYFDIVAGVLQGDTLAPYLFIICLDYVLRTSIDKIKENGFELTKKRSRRYPATTITDADYADDIAILANTPDQAETLLHSLERAAASIGLYVNAHKTEYMCYNQTGDISTLEGTPLKLVDKFTYLGSSVESTEKDIETRLTKAWRAINRLSIIWKSDLTDKMKRSFFQAAVTSILLYGCTTWTLTKRLEKKLDGNYTRMLRAILNKSWQQHPTRHQLYGHLPPITKTIQVRRTRHAGHCWRSRDELIKDVLLWIPTHGRAKAGLPARTYIQQLCEDTRCCPEDLPRAMNDREEWRERVRDIRATSAIWWWWWSTGRENTILYLREGKILVCISGEGIYYFVSSGREYIILYLWGGKILFCISGKIKDYFVSSRRENTILYLRGGKIVFCISRKRKYYFVSPGREYIILCLWGGNILFCISEEGKYYFVSLGRQNTLLCLRGGKILFCISEEGKYYFVSPGRENTILYLRGGKILFCISEEGKYYFVSPGRENTILCLRGGKILFCISEEGKYYFVSPGRENTILCLRGGKILFCISGKIKDYFVSTGRENTILCLRGGKILFCISGEGE